MTAQIIVLDERRPMHRPLVEYCIGDDVENINDPTIGVGTIKGMWYLGSALIVEAEFGRDVIRRLPAHCYRMVRRWDGGVA
jgi:hypothetical protein